MSIFYKSTDVEAGRIVYKFSNANHGISVLTDRRLKVSTVSELNDVLDCQRPDNESGGGVRSDDILSNEHGLICFSENIKSSAQWGHYSDCARGIAIGFDLKLLMEKISGIVLEVEYRHPSSRFPVLGFKEIENEDQKDATIRFEKWFCRHKGVKSTDWKYEQEIRFILNADDCIPLFKEGRRLYFKDFFDYAPVREVVLGARCEISPRFIRDILKKYGNESPVKIRKAEIPLDTFEMEIRDINL